MMTRMNSSRLNLGLVEWTFVCILVAVVVMAILLLFAPGLPQSYDSRLGQCLEHGYADLRQVPDRWGVPIKSYCVRRVNGTDEVVPLEEVLKGKRTPD